MFDVKDFEIFNYLCDLNICYILLYNENYCICSNKIKFAEITK